LKIENFDNIGLYKIYLIENKSDNLKELHEIEQKELNSLTKNMNDIFNIL